MESKMERYLDRQQAGKVLAEHLKKYANKKDVIVLALPRGGVPVAYEIAKAISSPLDVFIVRKLGVPGNEELAMGAIATGGVIVFNDAIVQQLKIPKSAIDNVIQSELDELHRRESRYRHNQALPTLTNKTVILVDDGIATGATMRVAIKSLRELKPAKIIVAVPVAAYSTCQEMARLADEIVCPLRPENFYAVGVWYENFPQTSDEEVAILLNS